ncbi:hypothetical protein KGMB02408_18430 [Bacteroides faecalis]|uniref:Uncharacterized protein n=1 Tax=Bacteroides faecalis TaxID=2447885 RepID=A0A401LTJ7_9BACE|nr:hypothetical protein KGMB02408_18430 [Bacteroides faecalis]
MSITPIARAIRSNVSSIDKYVIPINKKIGEYFYERKYFPLRIYTKYVKEFISKFLNNVSE